MFIAVCSLFSFSSLFFSPPDTNQQKHDPFPISITHRQTLSTFSFPRVIVQIHRPYGDEILGSVSPRSKFRIHSLEQIAGTNLQTLLRHSSLQSTLSLSLSLSLSHITFFFITNKTTTASLPFLLIFIFPPNSQFNIPNLRVGTLDSLLSLSDDLVKVRTIPNHTKNIHRFRCDP